MRSVFDMKTAPRGDCTGSTVARNIKLKDTPKFEYEVG